MTTQIVSFHCVLRNRLGKVISRTFNRDVIAANSPQGDVLPGLVEGLQDLQAGEFRRIKVPAERGYGLYDPTLVVEVPRKKLRSDALQVGQEVLGRVSGDPVRVYRCVSLDAKSVVLDANHPLAGEDLVFEIRATAVRPATPEDFEESGTEVASPEGIVLH